MICPKCKKANSSNVAYCQYCGEKISRKDSSAASRDRQSGAVLEGLNTKKEPEKASGRKKIWVVAAVCAVAITVAAVCFASVFNTRRNDFKDSVAAFEQLEDTYELGRYEPDYQSLIEEGEEILENNSFRKMDEVKSSMEQLSKEIADLNVQTVVYQTAYEEAQTAIAHLYLKDEEKAAYQKLQDTLAQALAAFDIEACRTAAAGLLNYQEDIVKQNILEIDAMRKEIDGFDEGELFAVERDSFSSSLRAAQEAYGNEDYNTAYSQYDVCMSLVRFTQMAAQYGMSLEQVDISDYPKVRLYLSVRDFVNDTYIEHLDAGGFTLMESTDQGASYRDAKLLSAVKMDGKENLNIAIAADCSASMGTDFYLAQDIMDSFVGSMQKGAGDRAALYSFADYVDREMYFTSDVSALRSAIHGMEMGNMTALYDALVFELSEIVVQDGAKCVIAFTDGIENYSTSSKEFVIQKANEYHIPIYLIGIGYQVDSSALTEIAERTGGFYAPINDVSYMDDVYKQIYREQKSMYVLQYKTDQKTENDVGRYLYISYEDKERGMHMIDHYVPAEYKIQGFIFYDSDRRYLTERELDRLTEAEVRIALNEIYARRGYLFNKSPDMIQHFNSCSWYHGTETDMQKVAAGFNKYEQKNVDMLVNYECRHGLNGRLK